MGFILGNNFDIWRTCREQLFAYLLRVVYKCSCYNQSTHVVFLFVCFFFLTQAHVHTMQDTPIYLLFHFASASQIWRLNSKLYFDLFIYFLCVFFVFLSFGFCPHMNDNNKDQLKGKDLLVAYYDVDYEKNPKGSNYWRNR